jgi:outer membrane protein
MTMNKIMLFLCVLSILTAPAAAQSVKIGYINSDAIMNQLPEAQEAQRQLDEMISEWQAELSQMQRNWQSKFEEYDKMKLIMSEQRRADAERELMDLDRRIAEFRDRKFGQDGELFRLQEELIRPIQDRIFLAIQEIAEQEAYDYILDQSGDILLMYANERYDLTQMVLQRVLDMQ